MTCVQKFFHQVDHLLEVVISVRVVALRIWSGVFKAFERHSMAVG